MFIKISTEPDPEVQSVHTLVPPFSKIHCNTNLTSIPRSIKQSLPEWFSIYLTCQKNSKTYTVVNKNVPACFQKALLQGDCYMGRSNRAVAHDYLCLIILRAQVNDHISSVLMLSSDWVRSWKGVKNKPTGCSKGVKKKKKKKGGGSRPALGSEQPPTQWVLEIFARDKMAEALYWPLTSI